MLTLPNFRPSVGRQYWKLSSFRGRRGHTHEQIHRPLFLPLPLPFFALTVARTFARSPVARLARLARLILLVPPIHPPTPDPAMLLPCYLPYVPTVPDASPISTTDAYSPMPYAILRSLALQ